MTFLFNGEKRTDTVRCVRHGNPVRVWDGKVVCTICDAEHLPTATTRVVMKEPKNPGVIASAAKLQAEAELMLLGTLNREQLKEICKTIVYTRKILKNQGVI